MELKDLRKLPMPKLRDLAKQETELTGVIGMEKEELIKAIAQAKGIAYDESTKDVNAIHAVKLEIRGFKKQKAEMLTTSPDRKKLKKIQREVKLLKRLTRHLAHDAKQAAVAAAAKPAPAAQPAAPSAPAAAPAAETPPGAGS